MKKHILICFFTDVHRTIKIVSFYYDLLLCYFIILFYCMLIFKLHCQLVLRISGITKICYIKTRPNVNFSLYLKKAGLGSRNIVHLQNIILLCVGFCFLHVKPIRSLLIQSIPTGSSFRCVLKHFIVFKNTRPVRLGEN